jgi:Ni2+-binding GTPase involved in maturation of urease and hydrogenase
MYLCRGRRIICINSIERTGKTTLLRHVLENTKQKIGCIVNDVASVNIDAKLVRNDRAKADGADSTNTTSDLADTIELANGCACEHLPPLPFRLPVSFLPQVEWGPFDSVGSACV